MRRALLVASILLAGCAGRRPFPHPLEPGRDAVVTFETVRGEAVLPMVSGWVGNEPTWFVVDTGAPFHLLGVPPATRGRLARIGPRVRVFGPTGAGELVRPVWLAGRVGLDGWGWAPTPTGYAGRLSDVLDGLGIISPQALIEADRVVVLDLPARRMRLEEHPVLDGHFRFSARACSVDGQVPARIYVVDARVGDRVVPLMVDTGANGTTLVADLADELGAGPEAMPYYDAFGSVDVRAAHDVRLLLGDVVLDLPRVDFIGQPNAFDDTCHYEGRLGVDALNNCTIAMWPDRAEIACLPSVKGRPIADPDRDGRRAAAE